MWYISNRENFWKAQQLSLMNDKPCRLITHNWRLGLSGLAAPILQYLILAAWEGDFGDEQLIAA